MNDAPQAVPSIQECRRLVILGALRSLIRGNK